MRRQLFVIALVAACGAYAGAQAPAPQQGTKAEGTVLKNKAPVSKELLRVKLPKPQEADLSNGVHLIFLEDRRTPQVNFSMIIDGAGGYYDPAEVPGLAGFVATLMREGTTSKTSEQISEQLDRLAAGVSVSSTITSPFATVNGNGLTNNIDTVLALMADVLMNPSFPQVEIDRYKARTRAQLMQQRTQPGFLASERLNKVVYGNHPLARVSATPASLEALTRDKLVEFHKAHYVPDRAVLAVTGDMTFDQVKTKAEAAFASWKKAGATITAQTEAAPLSGPSVSLVVRPNSVQTSLRVGTQSIERKDPDFFALTVANRILGGPFGRLFEHLREQKGYTYGANSGFSSSRIRGAWTASTDVRSEVTDPALTDLLAEIKQMRDVPVPAKDLENAKRAIVGSFALLLESPNAILSNYIDRHFYGLPADYWDTYASNIEAVTAADVQRVAQKYWSPERLQIVAVGDLSKVEPALKKLGAVQVFDADGNPVSK
jgi:zinc protease